MTDGPPWRPARHAVGDVEVARTKLHREIEQWQTNSEGFRERGIILSAVADRWVELTFLIAGPTPTVGACVGIDYTNYDIEAPSVTFLDPLTRQNAAPTSPPVQLDGANVRPLLRPHPVWERQFLCMPGTFEYHTHPQHDGNPWAGQRRLNGDGRLDVLTNRIWDTCVKDRKVTLAPLVTVNVPGPSSETDVEQVA